MSKAPAAKAEGRSRFVPVPIRALNDERLSARHWRVLAIVALHDRMNKNGQGCWASNRRLAQETDLEYTRVADTISDLRAFGYITSEINPQNRNYRVHRVIYDDPTLCQSANGSEGYPQKAQPFANRQGVQAQPFAKMGPNPLPPQRGKSLKSEAGTAPKYMLTEADKKDRAFKVGTREANCAEAQPSEGREASEARAYLEAIEATLASPDPIERSGLLQSDINELARLADNPGLPEPICERARKLLIAAKEAQ